MPNLASHQSSKTTKMLLCGDSGAGKSGSVASLARAGYNVRILDMDNGLDALANLVRHNYGGDETLARIDYVTITSPMKTLPSGQIMPAKADAWKRAMNAFMQWPDSDFGPISSWTDKDVLVIDSLTFLAKAAMAHVLAMNGRLGQQAHQSDWFQGQQLIEGVLDTIYGDAIKCNVIVHAHVVYLGAEGGPSQGYPASLGKALSPKIGRFFNSVLMAKTTGQGQNQKRKILTNTTGVVELKNTNPAKVKPEYPLESGLADYFRDVREA